MKMWLRPAIAAAMLLGAAGSAPVFADDITLTCRYSTLNRTDTVTWGEGTNDEMCVTALFLGP